jgi:uncharacterized protein
MDTTVREGDVTMEHTRTFTAFAADRLIVSGSVETMLRKTKAHLDRGGSDQVLIFDDETGTQVDFDFRGTEDEVVARVPSHPLFAALGAQRAGPGRPKLGVVSREVSLLPRHWDWLEQQPNGISAALRRLVDEARKREPDKERARLARESASRFMSAMAGNLPDFEEASRALFAEDRTRLDELIRPWPKDIRKHLVRLLEGPKQEGPSPG